MNQSIIEQKLKGLFRKYGNEDAIEITFITRSASGRTYFRIFGKHHKAIGVYHDVKSENEAFVSFTQSFEKLGMHVPRILAQDLSEDIYLVEDLGDLSIYDLLNDFDTAKTYYKKAINELVVLQTSGLKVIDLDLCVPRKSLDQQSLQWDLNYFKYYFLKLQNIVFDEQKLEDDFQELINYLLSCDQNYFIHRDFQSRNILIHDGKTYLIDYQGGRKGPLQYDLVSLLYQVKAQLPEEYRQELIDHYLLEVNKRTHVNRDQFMKYYYPYALMRHLQVMGAYGFRGLYEKKPHFLESIPFAIKSVKNLLSKLDSDLKLPELFRCLGSLEAEKQRKKGRLKLKIQSFAYKYGIPKDESGHGAGFVFDCRFLPNPGRLPAYRSMSGLEKEVIDYLNKYPEVHQAKVHFLGIADKAITNYLQREFEHLNFNFGCTGGQHRSVYYAESLVKHIQNNYDVQIELIHTQKDNWIKEENE